MNTLNLRTIQCQTILKCYNFSKMTNAACWKSQFKCNRTHQENMTKNFQPLSEQKNENWFKKEMVLQLPMSLSYPKILHMILMKQKATRTYSKSFSFIIQSECSPWQVEVRKFLNESQRVRLINASSIQGNW